MRNKKGVVNYCILMVLHLAICILSGSLGWVTQIVIVQSACLFFPYICFAKIFKNALLSFLLTVPFFLIYILASILLNSFQTFPIWISGLCIALLTSLLLKKEVKTYIIFLIALAIIVSSGGWFMPNYLVKFSQQSDLSRYNLKGLKIVDENNHIVDLTSSKDKILIVDVWFTTCAPCIRQFPDLERVHNELKKDTNIRVIALNIPLQQSGDRDRAKSLTSKFSFEKVYFQSPVEVDKLGLKAFPITLVFDKQNRCIYAGDLLLNPLVYIDNIYSIIKKTK